MKKSGLTVAVAVLVISGGLALAKPRNKPVLGPEEGSGSPAAAPVTKCLLAKTVGADTLGLTSFDWIHSAGMGGQIAADTVGGIHFGWTYRDEAGSTGSRYPAYNHYDAVNGWMGVTNAANGPGRWGTIGCKPSGEGLFAYYFSSGSNYPCLMAVDAVPGTGLFDNYAIDTVDNKAFPHPYMAVASSETMYVIAYNQATFAPMFNSSFDGGVTWNSFRDQGAGDTVVFNFPNYNIAARHNRVAICDLDTFNNVVYKESFDYGATWNPWQTAIPAGTVTGGDTIVPYIQPVCFYDNGGKLYIADSYYQNTADTTGTVPYDNGIVVWDSANGVKIAATQTITAPTGWDQVGGSNTIACSWPWMAQAANGNLVITYTQFDVADTAANGVANGDIYAVKSENDGASWDAIWGDGIGNPIHISESPSPGAADGSAEDDRYPACVTVGDSVHFAWLCSKVAGSSFYDAELTMSMDPMLHLAIPLFDPRGGVTGNPDKTPSYRFSLRQSTPNPARYNADISFTLPKAGRYSLNIYNIAGQMVRSFNGNGSYGQNQVSWQGKDNNEKMVGNGIYFYQLNFEGRSATRKLVLVR